MGTGEPGGRRAVFLDRDGVINHNVFNPATREYESPLTAAQLVLIPGVREALQRLQAAGFLLFLVSNQPNYAKGKSSLAELDAIDRELKRQLAEMQVEFAAFYYCLHHPYGDVAAYSGRCVCRKPSPYFLFRAAREFGLNLEQSWMVGDRATDILCGRAAGVRTIFVGASGAGYGEVIADRVAENLAAAAEFICNDAIERLLKLQIESLGVVGDGDDESIADRRCG